MTNFARIIDGVAVDVSVDPAEHFHLTIAAEFVPVPDDVRAGWRQVDGEWQAPAQIAPEPAAPEPLKVSPVEFKLLFTATERVAVKASDDAMVADFFSIVEDPRLTFVDLGLQSTKDGLAYLVHLGILTEERAAQILSGELQ